MPFNIFVALIYLELCVPKDSCIQGRLGSESVAAVAAKSLLDTLGLIKNYNVSFDGQ